MIFAAMLCAQQGQYQRKSVTSVESVWLSGSARQMGDFNFDFYNRMIDLYIKVPRFDYNVLPESSTTEFRNRANALSNINATSLGKVMEETVGLEIKKLLSDPDIQRARSGDLESESAKIQLAKVKGREYGLTEDMIIKLMNSAYIYLPYITKINRSYENNIYTYTVEGGILWYRVHIASDGKASLVLRQSATSMGIGSADSSKPNDYREFPLGNKVFKTSPQEYAQFDALQAWMKNLGVKMKEIPEFSLSAQIVERLPGGKFSAELGKREGVHMDDGFFVVDLFEDAAGEIKKKTLGYARIIKTADNRSEENRNQRSIAKPYYGSGIMEGAVLLENPRLGIDLSVFMGPRMGLSIPVEASNDVFSEEATAAFELGIGFAYNIAPIIGINQLFYDLELAYGIPAVEYKDGYSGASIYTVSGYTGLTKKAWMGRNALALGLKLGYDRFVIDYADLNSVDSQIATNSVGLKLGLDYAYMLAPNWLINVGFDFKASTPPFSTTYTSGGSETTLLGADDINLGGVMLKVGINHALGQLPVNLFGWLDPLKKY